MMKYRLSSAAGKLEGQPMFKVLAKVQELERQGRDIVHFEIGDPDFNTPANIVNAACESLKRGKPIIQVPWECGNSGRPFAGQPKRQGALPLP